MPPTLLHTSQDASRRISAFLLPIVPPKRDFFINVLYYFKIRNPYSFSICSLSQLHSLADTPVGGIPPSACFPQLQAARLMMLNNILGRPQLLIVKLNNAALFIHFDH